MRRLGIHIMLLAFLCGGVTSGESGPERATAAVSEKDREAVLGALPQIAFVRRKAGYGLRGTNATMFAHRTEKGSAIEIFDPRQPGQPPRVIFTTEEGFVWDLDLSWDGKRILFTHKTAQDAPFHLWEIGVDGKGLRQLTDGPYHDFNGVYYPDGRIVFCSSRVESYSLCQNFLASALYTCHADGTDIRRFDFTTLCTMKPSVLDDGSVLCTRWEYQDKNIFMWQGLWTLLPDGRQLQLYYGNTITVPNSRYGGKPVPGTGDVLLTMAAHHHPPVGDIAVLNRRAGIENPAAMRKVTFETPYRISKGDHWQHANWGPGDVFYPAAATDPWPLEDNLFLASFGNTNGLARSFRLCVCRYDGTRYPLREAGENDFSAMPLRVRPLPATIIRAEAPQVAGEGVFYVQDVYRGLEEQGVARGQVKALRVMRQLPKKWNTEGPRFHDHYPIIGYGSYYVKENLGEVPVDEKGSAYFRAPSNCELYFIALDKDGKEVQRMGSVTQITTGERVSCVGCHEPRMSAPPAAAKSDVRSGLPPSAITPPPWGAGPVDYVRHVQPVFDRYCVRCHSGTSPAGRADLSGDKTRFFNMSYDTLIDRRMVAYYYINPGPTGAFPALKTGTMASRLTQFVEDKHHGVEMDGESRRRIYAWVDANVQYYSTYDMSRTYTMGGRDTWNFVPDNRRVQPQPEPWLAELEGLLKAQCASCHGSLSEDAQSRKMMWVNLTRPENSRLLNAHLVKPAGGLGLEGTKNGKRSPVIDSTRNSVYVAMLAALRKGKESLDKRPRMDMPGGVAIPQVRDFGKTF
jgi:mono/diheme cytochrome c family protein